MVLFHPRSKPLSKSRQKAFWRAYAAGTLSGKKLTSGWMRKVVRISPSIAGTIREFENRVQLREYKTRARNIEQALARFNPNLFEIKPVEFLSQKNNLLVERVYRAPNIFHIKFQMYETRTAFLTAYSRYFPALKKRLEKKGVRFSVIKDQLYSDLNLLWSNIEKCATKFHIRADFAESNMLVHDYDPVKRKFLISFIDVGGSKNTHK